MSLYSFDCQIAEDRGGMKRNAYSMSRSSEAVIKNKIC
jgi:hypothetical protein